MTLEEINKIEDDTIEMWISSEEEKNKVRSCWGFQHDLVYLYGDPCFMEQEDMDRLMDKWVNYINAIFKTKCSTVNQAQYVFDAWKYKSQVEKIYWILRNKDIDRYTRNIKLSKKDLENIINKISLIVEI